VARGQSYTRSMISKLQREQEGTQVFYCAVLLVVIAMAIRLALIKYGLAQSTWIDLKIYRSAGALFNAGINPFDSFAVNGAAAESIRVDPRYFDSWASDPSVFSYYVSGNPPLSVLFWAVLEFLGRGTALFHQLVYSSFDIVVYCIALLLHRQITTKIRLIDVIGISLLTIFNPIVIWWGTWLPEEKQVQTALVLSLLLLMSRPRFLITGLVTSLVVLFKAVGLPLAIVVAVHLALKRDLRAFLKFAVGGLIPLVASLVFFGAKFIEPLLTRLKSQSSQTVIHDSMWVIAPSLFNLRLVLTLVVAFVGVLFSLRNIRSEWKFQFWGIWISFVTVMMLTVSGSWDRQMMVLLPTYLILYSLKPNLRALLLAQAIAFSWFYFWCVWLANQLGFVAPTVNGGPWVSFFSVGSIFFTLLFDLVSSMLREQTQKNCDSETSDVLLTK
jgi:hypothetical protein